MSSGSDVTTIDRSRLSPCFRPVWFGVTIGVAVIMIAVESLLFGKPVFLSWIALAAVPLVPLAILAMLGFLRCESIVKNSLFRIRYTCPECSYQGLPEFMCPDCGKVVEDLQPSIYGVLYVPCADCGAILPAADCSGRLSLPKKCPNCQIDQDHAHLGHRSEYRIAVVGATSSGKTNQMITSVWQLEEHFAPHNRLAVSFGKKTEEEDFRRYVDAMKDGQSMLKTVSLPVPRALTLALKREDHSETLLYVYDAAGEDFEDQQRVEEHPLEKYDGIMFVVDPFAEEGIRREVLLDADEDEVRQTNPAPVEASEILARLVNALERIHDVPIGSKFQVPIAVSVTKTDACSLAERMRVDWDNEDREFFNTAQAANHYERYTNRVRGFLEENGMGNFVGIVESRFARVSYFAVSALAPAENGEEDRGFQPRGVAAPLIWLAYHTYALHDTGLFDRVFMNWHVYFTRCLRGREGDRAKVISWVSVLILALTVLILFLSVDIGTIFLCGGAHLIALVILYVCLYFALIRGRFDD